MIPKAIINGYKLKASKLKLSELGALVLCALVSTGMGTLLLGCKGCKSEEAISQAQCHKLGGVWIGDYSRKTVCEYPPSVKCAAEKEDGK